MKHFMAHKIGPKGPLTLVDKYVILEVQREVTRHEHSNTQ
jgi:hypothetical protein